MTAARHAPRNWSIIGLAAVLGSSCVVACRNEPQKKVAPPHQVRAEMAEPATELTAEFLKRGHSALLERVGSRAELLEMRATGRQFSVIVSVEGKLQQIDYVEPSPLGKGQDTTQGPSTVTSVGKIFGPDPVQMQGQGPLEGNLFPIAEVNLPGVAGSFPVAIRAVDPEFGRVSSVVVRRFLPFSTGIRARIYVDSPSMGGSIDTNERGIPLKKW